jgi:CheY-like chemotaxis protein
MLLTEGLASYGLKVDCAATAEQAMSLMLGTKYDAILCDLKLSGSGPNADGYGVAQRLKIAAGENKPEVIYMSGDLVSEEGGNLPPEARRLQKPFRISDVLHLLTEVFAPAHSTKH